MVTYSFHNAITQLPAALEHSDAAMVNVFVPPPAVMGHRSALMVETRWDVVSYYSDHLSNFGECPTCCILVCPVIRMNVVSFLYWKIYM